MSWSILLSIPTKEMRERLKAGEERYLEGMGERFVWKMRGRK